jgi:hypothetical protein
MITAPETGLSYYGDWLVDAEVFFALRTFPPRMIVDILTMASSGLFIKSTTEKTKMFV